MSKGVGEGHREREEGVDEKDVKSIADALSGASRKSSERAAVKRGTSVKDRAVQFIADTATRTVEHLEGVRHYSKQLTKIADDLTYYLNQAKTQIDIQANKATGDKRITGFRHPILLRGPRHMLAPVSGVRQMPFVPLSAEDVMRTEGYQRLQHVLDSFNDTARSLFESEEGTDALVVVRPDIDQTSNKYDFLLELDFAIVNRK